MWIKWKYNDHGHKDFQELEIPNDTIKDYGCVAAYLEETERVPHWSERYCRTRIHWKKIRRPAKETLTRMISHLTSDIKWRREKLKELKSKLKGYN